MLQPYQQQFIEFALAQQVLKFGQFTLKSGRLSPYFFNMGEIKSGSALRSLGQFYAASIAKHFESHEYDIIFGPAYKGITLASAAAIALSELAIDKGYTYNRKEAKDHGEGGVLVGADLKGKKVLLIDDVITSGKTIHEAKSLVTQVGGHLIGAAIALNRQEKSLQGERSAIDTLSQEYDIKIASIITLADIIEYINALPADHEFRGALEEIFAYREQYGN